MAGSVEMIDGLLIAALWALAATAVAYLPMRLQMVPGLMLLLAAPIVIGIVWSQFGVWIGLAASLGFVSMFRKPLSFLLRRAHANLSGVFR